MFIRVTKIGHQGAQLPTVLNMDKVSWMRESIYKDGYGGKPIPSTKMAIPGEEQLWYVTEDLAVIGVLMREAKQ